MPTLRLGKTHPETRSWAIADELPTGHLLSLLLHGNLGGDLASCGLLLTAAIRSANDAGFEQDLGFHDSVAVSFSNGLARLEPVTPDDSYELPASTLADVVRHWMTFVSGERSDEVQIEVP